MGTGIEKINGNGLFASVPEDAQKQIIEMYCQGMSVRAIEQKTGFSKSTINEVKIHAIDRDSHLRDKLFNINLRQKLQTVVDHAVDRVDDMLDDMSAKDVVIAFGVAADKLMALDKGKSPDQIHQHLHLHTQAELTDDIVNAMKPRDKLQ